MLSNFNEQQPIRMATYSQDGLGLGHMRRTHSIVGRFLQDNADSSVLTLSDSQLGQFFTPTPNHDYLKLPSIVKDGPGQWRASNLNMPFPVVSMLRQELISQTLLTFRPHILLVDHMPHGAMGELLPALIALREQNIGTKIVLGLRDILDAPEVVRSRWQVEGAYDAVEEFYDCVLIYGMQEVFDMAQAYDFSPSMARRLRYCGYVCAPQDTTPQSAANVQTLRSHFLADADADAKLVVAMAGGGADAYPLMSTLLDTLTTVQQQQPTVYVLITGPFMPAHQRQDLQQRAEGLRAQNLHLHVLTSMNDTYSYLQAADLVVAMAGYNTTVEILQTGRRAILVPRRGPSAEQRTHTRLFANLGWIDTLDPDDLSIDNLAMLVKRNLQLGTNVVPPTQPNLNGRQAAAQWLFALASTPTVAGHRHAADAQDAPVTFDEPQTEIIFAEENYGATEERIYELA